VERHLQRHPTLRRDIAVCHAEGTPTGGSTFKALREAREQHVHQQLLAGSRNPAQRAIASSTERATIFHYAGRGHVTAGDELLATAAAARAREHRRLAKARWAIEG